jgi:hypothetical protein
LSGIEDMTSIPVGETKRYYFATMRDEGTTAEQVLASLSYLAILTFGADVFSATAIDSRTGAEVTMFGGQFGRIAVDPIFACDGCLDSGYIDVEHESHTGDSPETAEDSYAIGWGESEYLGYVDLAQRYGDPAKGYEWGLLHAERSWREYAADGATLLWAASLWVDAVDSTPPPPGFQYPEGSQGRLLAVFNEFLYPDATAWLHGEPSEYSSRLFVESIDEVLRYRPLGP